MTTKAHENVYAAVESVQAAVENLDAVSHEFNSTTVEEAAVSLAEVQAAIVRLRRLEAGLELWVAECFRAEGWKSNEPRELPLGSVEVRRSTTRRAWDHQGLRRDFLNAYLDRNGGEAPDPFTVVEDFLKVASINGWKVTGLREYGLEANDYCDHEPGTPKVVVNLAEQAEVVELPARQDGAA